MAERRKQQSLEDGGDVEFEDWDSAIDEWDSHFGAFVDEPADAESSAEGEAEQGAPATAATPAEGDAAPPVTVESEASPVAGEVSPIDADAATAGATAIEAAPPSPSLVEAGPALETLPIADAPGEAADDRAAPDGVAGEHARAEPVAPVVDTPVAAIEVEAAPATATLPPVVPDVEAAEVRSDALGTMNDEDEPDRFGAVPDLDAALLDLRLDLDDGGGVDEAPRHDEVAPLPTLTAEELLLPEELAALSDDDDLDAFGEDGDGYPAPPRARRPAPKRPTGPVARHDAAAGPAAAEATTAVTSEVARPGAAASGAVVDELEFGDEDVPSPDALDGLDLDAVSDITESEIADEAIAASEPVAPAAAATDAIVGEADGAAAIDGSAAVAETAPRDAPGMEEVDVAIDVEVVEADAAPVHDGRGDIAIDEAGGDGGQSPDAAPATAPATDAATVAAAPVADERPRFPMDAPAPVSRLASRPAPPTLSVPGLSPAVTSAGERSPEHDALIAAAGAGALDVRTRTALLMVAVRAAERARDAAGARARCEELLAEAPDCVAALRALRRLAIAAGDVTEAVDAIERERAHVTEEESAALAVVAAELRAAAGDVEPARAAFRREASGHSQVARAWAATALFDVELDYAIAETLPALQAISDAALRATFLVEHGRRSERAGDARAAAGAFSAALDADPTCVAGALGLIRLATANVGVDERTANERLARAVPDALAVAARRRGAALRVATEDPDDARAAATLIARDTDEPSLELRLRIARAAGDERAVIEALVALAGRSTGEARCDRLVEAATLMARRGEPDRALLYAKKALEAAPGDPRAGAAVERYTPGGRRLAGRPAPGPIAARLEARALAAEGRTADAESVLLRAVRDDVAGRAAVRELAELQIATDRPGEAASTLVRSVETAEGGDRHTHDLLLYRAARLEAASGAPDAALGRLRSLTVGLFGDLARRTQIRVAEEQGTESARSLEIGRARAAEAERAPPGRAAAALRARAAGAMELEDRTAAIAMYVSAVELDRDHPAATVDLELVGERAAAAKAQVSRLDGLTGPEATATGLRAALLLERIGEPHTAIECYARVLAGAGTGAAITVEERLTALARRTGDLTAEGALLARKDADADPGARLRTLIRRAERSEREGRPDDAIAIYREALARDPASLIARAGVERLLIAAGRHDELRAELTAELASEGDAGARIAGLERLVRLLQERFDDQEATLAACASLVELDPAHHPALRALERAYQVDGRDEELLALYDRARPGASDPRFAAVVSLERARLRERLGSSPTDIQRDLRRALGEDPACRPALRALLSLARRNKDAAGLSELCDRAAELYADRAPTSAAFLAASAAMLAQLGQRGEAAARYREAIARGGAQTPWVRALLHVSLAGDDAADAISSAVLAMDTYVDAAERVRAGMAAGTLAADRAQDEAAALAVFRRVLVDDPGHPEAFERVNAILDARGEHASRAEVIAARASTELDPQRASEMHLQLALLHRAMGDGDRAGEQLQRALDRDPQNGAALAELSDLHEASGAWAEAADALIRRARLEKDPTALKDTFFRLGLIYTEHLPDPQRAIASFARVLEHEPDNRAVIERLITLHEESGDSAGALGMLARLSRLETQPALRIPIMLRGARIQEGLGETRAAVELIKRALGLDPMNIEAFASLTHFYERQQDATSARIHLDTTLQHLRRAVARQPLDAAAHHGLFEAFRLRRSNDQVLLAAQVLRALGAATLTETVLLNRQPTPEPAVPPRLADPAADDLLFPAGIPPGFRTLFQLLADPLARLVRGDLKRYGVSKADRAPRAHAAREAAARVAAALGIKDVELYVSKASPNLLTVDPSDPISIIVGERLLAGAGERELAFFFARVLKPAQAGLAVAIRATPDELGVLVGGIVRQLVPDFVPRGFDAGAVAQEAARLAKVVPKKQHGELLPFALECAAPELDYRAIAGLMVEAGNRAGLIAAGTVDAALAAVRRVGDEAQARALVAFAVSEDVAELRRLVGVAVP